MLVDASPLKRSVVEGTDIMVIRELTGGLYFGEPRGREKLAGGGERGVNTMVYTTAEIERVARMGFEVARKRRKHLASVDKANVLTVSQLWREVVTRCRARLSRRHPGARPRRQLRHGPRAQAHPLRHDRDREHVRRHPVRRGGHPGRLHGHAALGLLGGGGWGRGGPLRAGPRDRSRHRRPGDRQPHRGVLSAAMLLRYSLDMGPAADRIEAAVRRVLEQGHRTRDIAAKGEKTLGTKEMGDLIVRGVEQGA